MAYILPITLDPSPAPAGKVKIVALSDGLYIVDDQGALTGPFGAGGSGDMLKSTYDTNNNGIVDNSEKLAGVMPTSAFMALVDDATVAAMRSRISLPESKVKKVIA